MGPPPSEGDASYVGLPESFVGVPASSLLLESPPSGPTDPPPPHATKNESSTHEELVCIVASDAPRCKRCAHACGRVFPARFAFTKPRYDRFVRSSMIESCVS